MAQSHSIQWDPSLPPFSGIGSKFPEAGYAIEAMAKGTNFGNPEAIIEVVKSLLADGSLAVLEGWDNREAPIRLRLSAPTAVAGPALAEAEKALMHAVLAKKKAPLVYVPIAQDSATCVFDVVAAKLERDTEDEWTREETFRSYRYYLLTLTCLPFVRPPDTEVVPALAPTPPTPTNVTIDDGSSVTAWTVTTDEGGTTSKSSSGSELTFGASGWPNAGTHQAIVKRTGAIAMGTTTKYLRIRMAHGFTGSVSSSDAAPSFFFWSGTTPTYTETVATAAVPNSNGLKDYYFLPPANIDAISYTHSAYAPGKTYGLTSRVDEIVRTDTLLSAGTTRQQARLATVTGSAPTQAEIRLFDPTPAALGTDILVHTSSNTAWQPALRPYRKPVNDTVTADDTMVSGSRNVLDLGSAFIIPARLLTEGTYALMARIKVSSPASLTWRAGTSDADGNDVVGSATGQTGTIALAATGSEYKVVNLLALALPVVRTEGEQCVRIELYGAPAVTLDEAWLFGLHDGALTWLQDADSLSWIEIRSPELSATRPSVYGGTGAKGANAVCVDWKCQSFGAHRFDPGPIQITTITTTSKLSQSEIEYYPRSHSHVEGSAA